MSREYHLAVVAQRDEQLAAMATQVAAGQALADRIRSAEAKYPEGGIHLLAQWCSDEHEAFLAAYPPAEKGGAR